MRSIVSMTLFVAVILLVAGCGEKQLKYNAAMAETQAAECKIILTKASLDRDRAQVELDECEADVVKLVEKIHSRGDNLNELELRLNKVKQTAEQSTAKLEVMQASRERKNEMFRELLQYFKSHVSAGLLKVELNDGLLALVLNDDTIFETHKKKLDRVSKNGKRVLADISKTLQRIEGRTFMIVAHMDDKKPYKRFKTVSHLSLLRAEAVRKQMIKAGLSGSLLGMASFGSSRPRMTGKHKAAVKANRRVEIWIFPNREEAPEYDPAILEEELGNL